jgi:hypothetical protein
MLELKAPWLNWHSPAANIPQTAFAANDPRRTHNWFTNKEPGGALTFELEAAQPAMARWAKARFAKLRKRGGTVTRPRNFMEQILDSPTVNLTSSHVESMALAPTEKLDLPATFFVDSEGLSDILGLASPTAFTVTGSIYAKCLEKYEVRMDDGEGFTVEGDTHFCFLVPERAFEDQVVLREVVEMGLVTRRLAACLLMVDPWNPIFSDRRSALLRHVPPTATIAHGKSTFSRDLASAILAAAPASPAGSPEHEFAARWKAGNGFAPAFNAMLRSYYAAVSTKLKTQAGFEAYFELAADRRRDFQERTTLAEFPLLLPQTNIPAGKRSMKQDGTVVGA